MFDCGRFQLTASKLSLPLAGGMGGVVVLSNAPPTFFTGAKKMDYERAPARFSYPSPVKRLRAFLSITVAEEGSLELPEVVRWAFALNEGDVLTAEREDPDSDRFIFKSYMERVAEAWRVCSQPWPYIEEMLRLPLAAMGPQGLLQLPPAGPAWRRGDRLVLSTDVDTSGERTFALQPQRRPLTSEVMFKAIYTLRARRDFTVILPADALWVLGFRDGTQLACKTALDSAHYGPYTPKLFQEGPMATLGPGGALALPASLRDAAILSPEARVRLSVSLSSRGGGAHLDLSRWREVSAAQST